MPPPLPPDLMQRASSITEKMLKGARGAREIFMRAGKEIAQYAYSPDYQFEYHSLPAKSFFRAKVALTAEAMRVFGPYLYQVNPHRTSTVRDGATPQMARVADIVTKYLNYTPGKLDLYHNERRVIDEAISWGRGCIWTDVDPTTGLVGSEQFSVRDLLVDPDCQTMRKARYIFRRHRKQRVEAQRLYPKANWSLIQKNERNQGDDNLPWEQKPAATSDMVSYWCLYTKHGMEGIEGYTELVKAMQEKGVPTQIDLTQPAVFILSENGKLLGIEPWSVPFYKEDEFPVTVLDFYDSPSSPWPASPLEPAMGFQRAINWIVTLMMGKYRFTSRTVGAIMDQDGQGLSDASMGKLLMGNDIEMLSIKVKGEVKTLNQFVSEINWSQDYLSVGMSFMNVLEQRFQKASGLYEILYSGETGTQSRSATDASVKDRNSQSRVHDMRDQVEKHATAVARKEAQVLRFLKDGQHIGKVLGPEDAKDWGFLVKPGGDDVMAMTQQFAQQFAQQGMPPNVAMRNGQLLAQEKAKQAVDFDRWMLETDYAIEADSIKRRDIDQRIDSLKELMNQLVPTQLQSPNPMVQALGYDTTASYLDAIGADRGVVNNYRMMAAQLRQPPPMLPLGAPAPQPPANAPAGA